MKSVDMPTSYDEDCSGLGCPMAWASINEDVRMKPSNSKSKSKIVGGRVGVYDTQAKLP